MAEKPKTIDKDIVLIKDINGNRIPVHIDEIRKTFPPITLVNPVEFPQMAEEMYPWKVWPIEICKMEESNVCFDISCPNRQPNRDKT